MHDIRKLRDQAEEIRSALARKGFDADVDRALELDRERRELIHKGDELKAELNRASKAIGAAKKAGGDAAQEMEAAREIRENAASLDDKKRELAETLQTLLLSWPAPPDDDVPEGLTENENIVVETVDGIPPLTESPRDHLEFAEDLGILDMPRGAKVTGSAWPMYVGAGATLERALIQFMIDVQVHEHGYTELMVPLLVNRASVTGTAQLPKLQDDMYLAERDDLFLIPTSEVPITNFRRDEMLTPDELPLRYAAQSACFRREAGTYGADTRGLLRVHQFNKVELVQVVEPDDSPTVHREILSHATKILEVLGLRYRVVELCAGELSFAAAKCFDIEVHSPATGHWLEVSSVSNFRDFQSRRMNLRVKPAEKKQKPYYPHTLNGSGLATSRLMVALLETYQNPDGSLTVPEPLRPYMRGMERIARSAS